MDEKNQGDCILGKYIVSFTDCTTLHAFHTSPFACMLLRNEGMRDRPLQRLPG